jgi:hypothetical protein
MSIDRRQFLQTLANAGAAAPIPAQVSGSATAQESGPQEQDLHGEQLTLKTQTAVFKMDQRGSFTAIIAAGRNCLAVGQHATVLSLRVNGNWHEANRAAWTENRPRRATSNLPLLRLMISETTPACRTN